MGVAGDLLKPDFGYSSHGRAGQNWGGKRGTKWGNLSGKAPQTLHSIAGYAPGLHRFLCPQHKRQFLICNIFNEKRRGAQPARTRELPFPPPTPPSHPLLSSCRHRAPRAGNVGDAQPRPGGCWTPEPVAGGRRYAEYLDRKAVLCLVS